MPPRTRIPGPLGIEKARYLQATLGSAPAAQQPLTFAQQAEVNVWERYRKEALTVATGILLDFAERVTMGDPSVSGKNPSKLDQFDEKDALTLRGLRIYLSLFPNSFDWLNDPSAKRMLDTIQIVITLFIQNAQRTEPHVLLPQPPNDPTRAARAQSPMAIYPVFFEAWVDPLGPLLAITHEYFHYLFVPGTGERIVHGLSSSQRSDTESALANAYELSGLAMWLAFGRVVNGK